MRVTINDVPSETLVNTVLIYHNYLSPTNTLFFRCYKCGTGLNQIQGQIGAIYAGYVPNQDVPIITRCYNCRENYTFQSQTGKTRTTKLILSTAKTVTTFHCIICRRQLLQYNKTIAALLPDFKAITYPSSFPCFNPICQAQYLLKDIVEPEMI